MNKRLIRLLWNLRICARLMQRDLFVFKTMAVRRLINSMIWTAVLVYMYEYIGFGSYAQAGLFVACGECAQWGAMGIFGNLVRFLCDMKGSKTIAYHLTLPLPQWLVLVSFCLSLSVQLMVIGALILPVSYLIMWGKFPVASVSLLKVFCIFFWAYLFYGVLTLLYASLIDSLDQLNRVRVRIGDMLFWTGAYFFTWHRLYETNPVIAYVDLLNPLVYAAEGMRAAVMGQQGFLPFWGCCGALLGFTFLIGTIAVKRMLKRLDCL
jgi:ABC-2 type transport system permease protein